MPAPRYLGSQKARNTKLGGVGGSSHENSFWCKFRDLGSTFSRSNDVINANFSPFLVKRAELCFSWPGIQSKTDSFNSQKSRGRTMNYRK